MSNVDELIQECEALKVEKSFKPMRAEMIQNIRNRFIKLFADDNKINEMIQMKTADLSRELAIILRSVSDDTDH